MEIFLYRNARQWARIRTRVLKNGESIRSVALFENMSRHTVRKILRFEKPPPFNLTNRAVSTKVSAKITAESNKKPSCSIHKQRWMEWLYEMEKYGIKTRYSNLDGIEKLENALLIKRNNFRKKILTVLAQLEGFTITNIAEHLDISRKTARKVLSKYKSGGIEAALSRMEKPHKAEDEELKNQVFKLLHEPPSLYGINATTWKKADLVNQLKNNGYYACEQVLREILKNAGYKWRSAKVVLTSNDPDYREKYQNIQNILSNLKDDERFFSIDEYGPFSIKMKAGRKLSSPDEFPTVPQWQKSKGWLILTAALELSRNQVTHFYSKAKNTEEMIKMIETLLTKYSDSKKLYISWDAASWHMSKKLNEFITDHNDKTITSLLPKVELAPLPASAQFLNVIESVFSGMARSIIHNSNYDSTEEAKNAMDTYFAERNKHFLGNPKRAGNKIWGKERTASEFSLSNNCKDPAYR
jgi:transposase